MASRNLGQATTCYEAVSKRFQVSRIPDGVKKRTAPQQADMSLVIPDAVLILGATAAVLVATFGVSYRVNTNVVSEHVR